MRELLNLNLKYWKAYGQFRGGPVSIGAIVDYDAELNKLTLQVSDGRGHDHRLVFHSLSWSHEIRRQPDGKIIEITVSRVQGACDTSYPPDSMMARVDVFILALPIEL